MYDIHSCQPPSFGGRLPHFGPISLIAMSISRETQISLIHKFLSQNLPCYAKHP